MEGAYEITPEGPGEPGTLLPIASPRARAQSLLDMHADYTNDVYAANLAALSRANSPPPNLGLMSSMSGAVWNFGL